LRSSEVASSLESGSVLIQNDVSAWIARLTPSDEVFHNKLVLIGRVSLQWAGGFRWACSLEIDRNETSGRGWRRPIRLVIVFVSLALMSCALASGRNIPSVPENLALISATVVLIIWLIIGDYYRCSPWISFPFSFSPHFFLLILLFLFYGYFSNNDSNFRISSDWNGGALFASHRSFCYCFA